MLSTLALVLPLLAGVEALGGDHYVAHRSRVLKRNGNQKYDVLARSPVPEPAGGDHYAPYRNKVAGGIPVIMDRDVGVQYERDSAGNVLYDERGLPITATTTVIVPMTTTETVWVDAPTGSVEPTPSANATSSASTDVTSSSSAEPSPTSTLTPTFSQNTHIVLPPDPSGSPSVTSGSASGTQTESASPSPSSFSSVEPSSAPPSSSAESSSAAPSSSAEPSSSSWASEASSTWSPSSSAPHSSSSYLSSTASPSASETPSTSAEAPSSSASPTSLSESASPSETPSPSNTGTYEPSPTGSLDRRLMNGYYADWTASILPPESVDWSRFDVMNFAFAEPSYDGRLEFTQSNSGALLTRLAAGAHAAGKKVVLSVGGWTGSAHFSTIVANPTRRATFVQNIVAAIKQYKLDGIDLDWEYPGAPGAGGNSVSPDDSANFLPFLRELRAAVPKGSLITAATQVWPFYGADGQPLPDVSDFAEIFDWILIMNYDIWGSSSRPGPNAPLSDGCKNSEQPTANAYAAVASWVAAGMPASKITLGVAAYGYVQKSTSDKLYNRRWNMPYPPHRKRAVTVKNGDGGTADGQVMFSGLVSQGALVREGDSFAGAGGFTRHWDQCSSTPWLKSSASGQIITYDDPQSLNMKGQFAQQAGIRGCSMWSVDGDFIDGGWPLTDAVRSGMGI